MEETESLLAILSDIDEQLSVATDVICSCKQILLRKLEHKKQHSAPKVFEPPPRLQLEQQTTVPLQNELPLQVPGGVQVWELYVPKEDLVQDLSETPVIDAPKIYTKSVLDELKLILKQRHPEIFAEQEQLRSHNKQEEAATNQQIFRPQAPVGFSQNMLGDIFAARRSMIQQNEECFDDGTANSVDEDDK